MLTTTQAFDKFRQRLELSDTEQKDACEAPEGSARLHPRDFDLARDFLSGSYSRHTKTKPLKDVDVMFVLGEKERWRRDKPPIETLQAFEKCLKKTYTEPGQVEIGRRSVTVEFEKNYYPDEHEGKVLSIDAVPAFESGARTSTRSLIKRPALGSRQIRRRTRNSRPPKTKNWTGGGFLS